jgi:hypothetical protein
VDGAAGTFGGVKGRMHDLLASFAMHAPLARPDYYEASAPPAASVEHDQEGRVAVPPVPGLDQPDDDVADLRGGHRSLGAPGNRAEFWRTCPATLAALQAVPSI